MRTRKSLPREILPAVLAGLSLALCANADAMIFHPLKGDMWDPSILWHDGRFYAFMMYNKDGNNGLDAGHCLLATSVDGVHWLDEGAVNEERQRAAGNKFFKCYVARCGNRFIMDHGVARPERAGPDAVLWVARFAALELPLQQLARSALVRPATATGALGPHVHPA